MGKKVLLIIDDEKAYARSLAFALKKLFDVFVSTSYKEALRFLRDKNFNAALIDVRLDEDDDRNQDGLKILEWIKQNKPTIITFIMTSYKEKGYKEEAIKLGASYFFEKPIDILEMRRILEEKIV